MVAVLSALGLLQYGCWSPPRDSELLEVFESRSAEFERLVSLVQAAETVPTDGEFAITCRDLGVLEVRPGLGRPSSLIHFDMATHGYALAGWDKGIAFSTRAVSPIVESLDKSGARDRTVVYRRIKRDWYLYEYHW